MNEHCCQNDIGELILRSLNQLNPESTLKLQLGITKYILLFIPAIAFTEFKTSENVLINVLPPK